MRFELLYNPRLLIERLAIASQRRRRFSKLTGTVASKLKLGHIDSLELLEIIKSEQIQTIYDVGANVGTWSLLAKAIMPQAVLHAFEPLSIHFDEFYARTANIPDINLHKLALGAEASILNMQVASFSDASSLLEIAKITYDTFGIVKSREEAVQVVRLDDYIAQNKMSMPDLIKLDIQGYELEALKGAEKCLKSARYLIIEVSFIEFYTAQPLFHDIINFLSQRNFYLWAMGTNTPLGETLSQTDVLFIRKT